MQSIREIKTRIGSVRNTKQIAKAMEVVSATKMRRSQAVAINTRPFAIRALELFNSMNLAEMALPDLMHERPLTRRGVLVIASDKGLAGALNSNVLRKAETFIAESSALAPVDVVTIGKKAKDFFARKQANVIKEYIGSGDFGTFEQTEHIATFLIDKFTQKNWDEIWVVYTNFQSTLKQDVVIRQLLPITQSGIQAMVAGIPSKAGEQDMMNNDTSISHDRLFEPSAEAVLATLLPYLFRLEVYHAVLESNASEHSARMIAMKKASDNASEIMSELSLQYNKSRQAGITQELIEIIGGSSA